MVTESPETTLSTDTDSPSSSVSSSRPTSASDIKLHVIDDENENILEQTAIYKQLMKIGKL